MKPIREQLAEQARAIRDGWAKGPSPDGRPRVGPITLEFVSLVTPIGTSRGAIGRVNDAALLGVPAGHLLFRSIKSVRNGRAVKVGVDLVLREIPWNHRVLVSAVTTLGAGPKILVDTTGRPAYQSFDLDALLDALEPPGGRAAEPPSGPPPGSWRDRPSLL